jgi:diguanylate cyclase (GGDEF)-like protein
MTYGAGQLRGLGGVRLHGGKSRPIALNQTFDPDSLIYLAVRAQSSLHDLVALRTAMLLWEVCRQMSLPMGWRSSADRYDWIEAFLSQRGRLRAAQRIMALVCAAGALAPLSVLFSQPEPVAGAVAIVGLTAVLCVGMTVFYLTRWPTRRHSEAAVVVGVLCIGGWSFIQPTAALSALACTPTVVTGAFSAIFHRRQIVLFHGVVTAAITIAAVARLAGEVSVAAAISAFWVINFVNVSVLLGAWGMSRAMGGYRQRSEEDPLTGLLNRRAFTEMVSNRLANPPRGHTHLTVVMVDLDNFKRINDTHGHPVGDDALRAVSGLLLEHTPAHAVICRAGGEEFLIALTCLTSDIEPLAARICGAVASLSLQMTASIGAASVELLLLSDPENTVRIEELIAIADSAMYAAKRSGGNQARHTACSRAGRSRAAPEESAGG